MVERQKRQVWPGLIAGVGIVIAACTSARETNEYNATVPSTIQTDADRRAIYNNAAANGPIARPPSLNNRASEINRKKNIENRSENNPHNKPLEVRTLETGRPLSDTTR